MGHPRFGPFAIYSLGFLCERLSWCWHTARSSDGMQMLPRPWPPAHTMPGPKWHRCRATFGLRQTGAVLCRMRPLPTLLLCSLSSSSRSSPITAWWNFPIDSCNNAQLSFSLMQNYCPPPCPLCNKNAINSLPWWSVFQARLLARCLCLALSWLGLSGWLLHGNRLAL